MLKSFLFIYIAIDKIMFINYENKWLFLFYTFIVQYSEIKKNI